MLKISMYATECKAYYSRLKFIERKIKELGHDKKFLFHKSYYTDEETEIRVCCKTHGFVKVLPKELTKKKFKCPICKEKIEKAAIKVRKKLKLIRSKKRKTEMEKLKKSNPVKFKKRFLNNSLTTEQFIEKSKVVHKDKYDYSKSVYISARKPITITCPVHGDFTKSRAMDHYINGTGCPKCNKGGFKNELPAIVYYISINNGEAYKIGITNGSIKTRFQSCDRKKIKLLKTWYYKEGLKAREFERYIINTFSYVKYDGPDLLTYVGTNEMFKEDILDYLPHQTTP